MLIFPVKNQFFALLILLGACQSKPVGPPEPIGPLPNLSQLAWHEMEMNAFVHFSINTFTDKEWGFGDESPKLFNPVKFDASQWVRIFSEAGFRGVILTCKHHDGFCLWPSQYTNHSVKYSVWMNGNGDVVKAVADACKKYGLKLGVYLSPWDRNHKDYGTPVYLEQYRKQLTELFSNYGPIFEMWFDGANGGDGYYGGAREKRSIDGATYYEWPTTLDYVRKMSPSIIFFSDAGPGVRWVGNEKGIAGETNWSMLTPDTLFAGKAGIEALLSTGSENGSQWIPSEVDVSIRPGWFYHAREDSLVKSPEQLFGIYLTSVGRGSTLLLNIPPNQQGLIHEKDIASLRGFRTLLDQEFKTNLANESSITSSSYRGQSDAYSPTMMIDGDSKTYWATDDNVKSATIELSWKNDQNVKYLMLQEYIRLGQRIKGFTIDTWEAGAWKKVATGTTIGYKRIVKLGNIRTRKLRLTITDSRACIILHTLSVF